MNDLIKILALAWLMAVNSSCNKTKTVKIEGDAIPVADFVVAKSNYKGGETLVLTNASSNAAAVRWTLPDGTTSKSNSVSWATDTMGTAQTFQFKLEAISENATKSDYIVKNIKVNPTMGNVVLYGRTTNTVLPVTPATVTGTISVDGTKIGVVTIPIIGEHADAPVNCQTNGYPAVNAPIGTRNFNFEYIIDHGNHVHHHNLSVSSVVTVKNCVFVYFKEYFENQDDDE